MSARTIRGQGRRSRASARPRTTSTARRRSRSSSWRSRRSCAPARTPGIDPREIDGFASYSNDRNDPSRLAAALGLPDLRFSNMQWGGGGGGGAGAVGNAAAAVAAGFADCVVVFRALAQGQFARFGQGTARGHGVGRRRVHHALRRDVARPALRHARDALHARAQRRPRGAAGDRAGLLPPRPGQPARRHARPAAHRGGVRRLALDRRAVPPLRLLHGERRRRRAGPRCPPSARGTCRRGPPTSSAWPRARSTGTARRRTTRPLYGTSSFTTVAPRLYAMAGRRAQGRRRAAELRELHRRRPDEPGRARLLPAGGGQRVPDARQPARAEAGACRSTRAAATSPSATCTASSC